MKGPLLDLGRGRWRPNRDGPVPGPPGLLASSQSFHSGKVGLDLATGLAGRDVLGTCGSSAQGTVRPRQKAWGPACRRSLTLWWGQQEGRGEKGARTDPRGGGKRGRRGGDRQREGERRGRSSRRGSPDTAWLSGSASSKGTLQRWACTGRSPGLRPRRLLCRPGTPRRPLGKERASRTAMGRMEPRQALWLVCETLGPGPGWGAPSLRSAPSPQNCAPEPSRCL